MPTDDGYGLPLSARYRCLKAFFDFKWEAEPPATAANNWWRYCLLAIGSASSLVYPHPSLVSFATLAGITLNRRQAVVYALLIWFVNQVYGFTVRQYPLDTIALLWGMTMGLGTIGVVLIASMQPRFSQRGWVGQALGLGISLILGFALYQSSILFVNQWVGMHGLTAGVLLRIFGRDLVWAIVLFGLHTALCRPLLRHSR